MFTHLDEAKEGQINKTIAYLANTTLYYNCKLLEYRKYCVAHYGYSYFYGYYPVTA